MPRRYNIRWTAKDWAQVSKTAGQFNAKLNRLLYKNPELAPFLPSPIQVPDLVASIETRQDLNREVNRIARFLKPGAETPVMNERGVRTTQWQQQELKRQIQIINQRRTRIAKQLDISTEQGNMGTVEANSLQPKQFNFENIEPDRWNQFVANVENQVRANYTDEMNDLFIENYTKAVYEQLTLDHAIQIDARLQQIPREELIRLLLENPSLMIRFYYDPYEEQVIFEEVADQLDAYISSRL